MRKVSVGKIVIGVFTVILTLSLILFVAGGISEIRDAYYEPSYLDEESNLSALNGQDYVYLLEITARDSRLGKEYNDTVKACRAVAKYYEAASLYEAYRTVGDTQAADKQAERMEWFAGQTGEFESHVEKIDELFELEDLADAVD